MEIRIYKDEKLIGTCVNFILESNSNSLSRKVRIEEVNFFSPIELDYASVLKIDFKLKNNKKIEFHYCDFSIYVLNFSEDIERKFLDFDCFIQLNSNLENYNQKIIDVFSTWNKNIEYDWKISTNEGKQSYLTSCFYWCGIPSKVINKKITIDFDKNTNENDIYILLAEELIGKRGYIGYDLYSLEDCLIEIKKNQENNVEIVFISSKELLNFQFEIIKIFKKYNFFIECKSK